MLFGTSEHVKDATGLIYVEHKLEDYTIFESAVFNVDQLRYTGIIKPITDEFSSENCV